MSWFYKYFHKGCLNFDAKVRYAFVNPFTRKAVASVLTGFKSEIGWQKPEKIKEKQKESSQIELLSYGASGDTGLF